MTIKKNFILSPSGLNCYINDPALWVLRAFYGIYGDSNIYAIRGNLVELYVNMRIEAEPFNIGNIGRLELLPFKEYLNKAMTECMSEGIEITMEDYKSFYDWGKKVYPLLPINIRQQQLRVDGEIKGVKMGGFIDYEIKGNIDKWADPDKSYTIDLKTVNKLPIIVSRGARKGLIEAKKKDNVRQQIIYRILSGKPSVLLYVNEEGESLEYKIGYRDYKEHLPIIKEKIKEIKKLLTLTKEDVILEVKLDEKKINNPFMWSDELREKAYEIWGDPKDF